MIILAGLTSIPQDIHDAAAVDGAGFWRHLFQITLPLVMPVALVALLFGIVFTFTDLIVVFVLTRGGPYDTTQVLASWAYFTGIQAGDLAGGAAISLFLFPVLVAVAIVFLRFAPPHGGDVMTPQLLARDERPRPADTPPCWFSSSPFSPFRSIGC